MTKILITGGAGYIGSITTRRFFETNYQVAVVDSLENGHIESLPSEIDFINANLADKSTIVETLSNFKPDVIVDFAAYLAVGESMAEPIMYMDNNVKNFITLLDSMVETGCKFIVKSSTAATYGNPTLESDLPLKEQYVQTKIFDKSQLLEGNWNGVKISDESYFQKLIEYYDNLIKNHKYYSKLQLDENEISMLRIPSNVYGFTKLLDEILMKKYDNLFYIKGIALRYFNVAGANLDGSIGEAHPVETHLIPLIIQNIQQSFPLKIMGNNYKTPDGTAIRDYIHVLDLAEGHTKACEYLVKHNSSDNFNLGNGLGYSVLDVIKAVEKVTKQKVRYEIGGRRAGDPERLLASPKKANQFLGWQAKYSLEEMIESAWKWHSTHPKGYQL